MVNTTGGEHPNWALRISVSANQFLRWLPTCDNRSHSRCAHRTCKPQSTLVSIMNSLVLNHYFCFSHTYLVVTASNLNQFHLATNCPPGLIAGCPRASWACTSAHLQLRFPEVVASPRGAGVGHNTKSTRDNLFDNIFNNIGWKTSPAHQEGSND